MRGETSAIQAGRDVSPTLTGTLLEYVHRALGDEGLDRLDALLEPSGLSVAGLRDPNAWLTAAEAVTLFDAAGAACRDSQIGRRTGEEMYRQCLHYGVADIALASGSIQAACAMFAEAGSKMGSGRMLVTEEIADDHVLLAGEYTNVGPGSQIERGARYFCDVTAGFYSFVPAFFGAIGSVVELRCQVDGAERCEFRVSWVENPATSTPDAAVQAESARRVGATLDRFEELQSMASAILGADDVEGVLERIVGNVRQALQAPKYLLAVQGTSGLSVHQHGFRPQAASRFALRLLAGEVSEADGVLAVEVMAGGRHFGRLAAVFDRGVVINDIDRRTLHAYAGHAAAALNIVAALESARRDRDTAQALLLLARRLAEVGTRQEIAARICEAVPLVTSCDVATVYLYDEEACQLRLAAAADPSGTRDLPTGHVLSVTTIPRLADLAQYPQPVMVRADDTHSAALRSLFRRFRVGGAAIVPISARGRFLGIVTAGLVETSRDDDTDELFRRLGGLADHAATAFENAELLDRMRHEMLHDSLTGLPNRSLVEDRGRQAFARAARAGTRVGVLFIDLDRFKNINDTLGHHAGDNVIRAVAERLRHAMRAQDTLARLGGDEFVVLLDDVSCLGDATVVAERVIDVLRAPFEVAGQELFISCSVGVACSPHHGESYDSLLQYADSAMYAAKNHGRSTYAVDAMAIATPRRRRLQVESRLHRAIENDELRVHYQPVVELATGRTVAVEALVRWEHPDDGLVAPSEFLPLAEESGLIVTIDEWVRREAFAQARRWHDVGLDLRVAVNLSARTLANPDLSDQIAAEIAAAGIDPPNIELEVNERTGMEDDHELPAVLAPLRATGARIAIDDFGTGSSVLRRLQHCAVDVLKIDRCFIAAIGDDGLEVPLVRALLALAAGLDLRVVAEGVETIAQAQLLRRYGCELAQGHLLGAPASAAELTRRLSRTDLAPVG